MINTLRFIIFYLLSAIGGAFILLGSIVLTKGQTTKIHEVLDSLSRKISSEEETTYNKHFEPRTIEDEIFSACAKIDKENYRKGTNQDLSIECTLCGKNTKRGEYYARNDVLDTGAPLPYMFICNDCYEELVNEQGN